MTDFNSTPEPERNPHSRRRRFLRAGLLSGGVILIGMTAAGWWAWRFIHEQLAPLVSDNLSKTFDRPVEVGAVKSVGLNQLVFGESQIPATATDADQATIETVKVQFNLLELIWDRTLSLDVTLVKPEIYLDQDKEGLWINTKIQQDEEEQASPIKIELDTLWIETGTAQLAPYGEVESSQPVEVEPDAAAPVDEDAPATLKPEQTANPIVGLQNINGVVTFRNQNQLIGYNFTTQPETGGRLALAGSTNLEAETTTLNVNSRNLLAPDVSLLVPLPLKLTVGRLATDLKISFLPNNQPLQFDGTVRLSNVTALLDGAPKPFQQVNGGLRFRGQQIAFQDFQGQYGAIPARVLGSLDTQVGYDLQVQVPRATVANILTTLDLKAADLPVAAEGAFKAMLNLAGPIDKPLITGAVANLEPVQIDRLRFARTEAEFTVTPQAVVLNQVQAVPSQGGLLTAQGLVKLGDRSSVGVEVQANDLPGDAIAAAYGANTNSVRIGAVDATAQIVGPLNAVQTIVQWQAPQATYPGRGQVVIAGSNIRFEDTALLVAGGIVRGTGQINQGRWQALLDVAGIQLNQFNADLRGLLSGDFQLAGSLDNLDPAAIQAQGQVRFSQGLALIEDPLEASVRWLGDRLQILNASARGFQGNGYISTRLSGAGAPAIDNLDLNVALQDYRLTDLPVTIPPQLSVAGTTDFVGKVSGPLDAIVVAGQLGLNNLAVNTLAFESRLAGDFRYALNRGLSLDVTGNQDRIAVVLDDRNLPQSFYVQQGQTTAQGRGSGDRLLASLRNFPLTALNLSPAGFGQVSGQLDGNFDINLADLSSPDVIGEVAIVNPALGYISTSAISTTPNAACFISPIETENSTTTCAHSLFSGKFRYIDGVAALEPGSQLQLGNSRYLLSGNYNPAAEPQFQGQIVADQGRIEDLFAALQWFETADLGRLSAPIYASAAAVEAIPVGRPDATLLNQLRRYSEIEALYGGQVAARETSSLLPELSTLQGGFTGAIDLAYSAAAGATVGFDLAGQNWQWGSCSAVIVPDPARSDANTAVVNLTEAPTDASTGASANSRPVELDSNTGATARETAAAETASIATNSSTSTTIPVEPLDRCQPYVINQIIAKGNFENGVLTLLPVSLESGESLLTFSGQVGGPQQSGQLIAQNIPVAPLRDLFNLPLDLAGDLNATGQVGGSIDNPEFEGELNLVNGTINRTESIPPLRSLFGYNNARLTFFTRLVPPTAATAGTPIAPTPIAPTPIAPTPTADRRRSTQPDNPATPEPTQTDSIATRPNFSSEDAEFQFDGSIPYKLPFATVAPDNYQLSLNLNVRNDGIGLINLFTDQVAWQGGEGIVQLQVNGTLPPDNIDLRSLTASGSASFNQAQIAAKALPQPLTNVNGNVFFENSQIRVESVTGDLGEGQVTAQGVIPLQYSLSQEAQDSNPLVVQLSNLSIELANLYDGDVDGRILVTGSVLAPEIGGEILLSNGRIIVPTNQANVPAATPATLTATPTAETQPVSPFARSNGSFSPPEYEALRVDLGERLRVTYDPVLNFLVNGSLLVTGTQTDPLLDGTVQLRGGQINLFTTQFSLVKGYANTAVFDSSRGLDPLLDVRLVTSVPEVTRYPDVTDSPFPVSEIVDTPSAGDFGAIKTVRIQATVTGPASQVFNNLELTSSPSRSETEILALIGGGFIGNVQGDATTALASIAGGPLLTSLQNLINDTLGISDFRLFPTTIVSEDASASLALAAELGVDITQDLSVSVLQLLTVQAMPQFSLRYRLTDQLTLRGSTNFSDENRAVLEFETRF